MLTPSAETIARSSTPARMTMPVRVRLSQTHSAKPITSASAEDEEPRAGVGEAAYVEVDELVDRAREGHVLGGAAARVHDDLVGHDHRDRDRDQRLAQLLALIPAQQHLLHHEPEHAGDERGDAEHDEPVEQADLRRGDRDVGIAR